MSEMVERIAKIIDPDAFDPLPGHGEGKCPDCDSNREEARLIVRRVIEAMREPTQAMIDAGSVFAEYAVKAAWEEMIDAALKDDK